MGTETVGEGLTQQQLDRVLRGQPAGPAEPRARKPFNALGLLAALAITPWILGAVAAASAYYDGLNGVDHPATNTDGLIWGNVDKANDAGYARYLQNNKR